MGVLEKKKTVPLSLFFFTYLLYLCAGILFIAISAVMSFNVLVSNHMIYYANYAQEQANGAADDITAADEVTEDMIPELCRYAVFDQEGNVTGGNISQKELKDAWKAVHGEITSRRGNYYKVVPRRGEYCVLQFQIVPQYRSPQLRTRLPNPQDLIFAVSVLLILLFVILISLLFGRALRKKLRPLEAATERIQKQDLDFPITSSGIREIDRILLSMDQMRGALKDSLQRQWQMEQSRKEQTAALAHDLKTPLTVIRGNTDLLEETHLTEEQQECVTFVQDSVLQMQDYVKALIELSRTEENLPIEIQSVKTEDFLSDLRPKIEGLLLPKKIELLWELKKLPETLNINPGLFARALLNIMANAAEFAPSGGKVKFEVLCDGAEAEFIVSDSGSGFSPKALANAAKQFYMEEDSRSSNLHYGMGLYIADTIVKKHKGTLQLGNSAELTGGRAAISIPAGTLEEDDVIG